jgi:DNA polymerase-4
MRRAGMFSRTIDLKIRSSDFHTVTRSKTLAAATNSTNVLWKFAATLLERSLTPDLLPVRLLGIGATKLTREPVAQGNLFEENANPKHAALDQTIDTIRTQFGGASIKRGSLLDRREEDD